MAGDDRMSLAKARAENKLDQFARDRDSDEPGDEAAFNRTLASMARTSKVTREALRPDCSDD